MSKSELVEAYVTQAINRRAFVQGLTALGVSAGVAAAYAVALQPAAAGNGGSSSCLDLYPEPDLYELYCEGKKPDGSAGGGKRRRRKKKHKKKH